MLPLWQMQCILIARPGVRQRQRSCTCCRVIRTLANGTAAVVQWRLKTGRTHQIRVHAQHLGCPLFGDSSYSGVHHAVSKIGRGDKRRCAVRGVLWTAPFDSAMSIVFLARAPCREQAIQGALDELGRPALHARVLGFKHPTSGEALNFESAIPSDLETVLEVLSNLYAE